MVVNPSVPYDCFELQAPGEYLSKNVGIVMTEATCFDMQTVCTSSKLGNDSAFLRISNFEIWLEC